jgi:hypothetical protein
MSAVAKAVHRGVDGSVHYLMSSNECSLLVVTDPALGVDRIEFDGPVRMLPPRTPLGVPGEVAGVVEYESISASGSTRVSVRPGEVPFIYSMGVCFSCSFPPLDRAGMGHDYELWPVCPGGKGSRTPTVVQAPEETVFHDIDIDHQKAFPVPGTVAQPAPEPAQPSGTGTGGKPTESSKESSRGKPRVRVLDAEPAPVQEEPLSRGEAASRWGPTWKALSP